MKRGWMIVLCLSMLLCFALPLTVHAQDTEERVVRVGWYESSYCYRDSFGERRGIAYEYQRKIAAHTGWSYEYVEDSWPNLLQMLIDGEIDLMSDVSYTQERAALMLFPGLAMGEEAYYLYIDADNTEITSDDLRSLDGKRVGVNKGSFQAGLLRDWIEKNGVALEIVELTESEENSMKMLTRGEIDAYVSLDSFGARKRVVPVRKVGASEYFFAVNKERPDLLTELNNALAAIQDEDPFFNQRLSDQYVQLTKTNAFLTPRLEAWVKNHGAIRLGYLDNYLPFCASDKQTGALNGALQDWLAEASGCLKNAEVRFETVAYPSTDEALEAMKRGEIDCVFPINLSTYSGESMGILTSNPIMNTEVNVLMRGEARPDITPGSHLTVAIDAGNHNFETLIREELPGWTIQNYADVEACCRAVASGEADVVLACNYRMGDYEPLREKYKLVALPTGETLGFSLAVNDDEPEMYSVLNKIVNLTKSENMEYALVSYMYLNQKITFMDFMEDNWIGVVAALSAVFLVIFVLLYQKLKAERKAGEQQRMLEEAAEVAELKQTITSLLDNMPGMNFTKDAKTGVFLACNQAFAIYARRRTPGEVVGHTDAELFPPEAAERFLEDDRVTLSMDKPYIYYEDVTDETGVRRQLQTTRLKYTDETGRLCILGICQDMTDTVRIRRENATSKDAYERARTTGIIYTHIAQALARGYTDLYYVNLDTEEYIEYRPDTESGLLKEIRHGWHFFEQCKLEAERSVYTEDRPAVLQALERKTLTAALERNKVFAMSYRLNSEAGPIYVTMNVSRMEDDERCIVLGVADVDEEMKQRRASERMKEEQIAYNRLSALAGDFVCLYVVSPETSRYREFSASAGFETYALPKEGQDFFADSLKQGTNLIYPEDLNRFLSAFSKEKILAEVEQRGIFTLSYRLMLGGKPTYVQLKAAMVQEKEGPRLIVGINDIDAQVRQEEQYVEQMAQARMDAKIDALTRVKNRHAYREAEERMNRQIQENKAPEFAIVILDVNDLKKVNDNEGHQAGDQLLRNACKIVCDTFKHSPVFRVGGDEFAVIAQGSDYAAIEDLVERMNSRNAEALKNGGIVIACGMAKYEQEGSVAPVFERADQNMYDNKAALKAKKNR